MRKLFTRLHCHIAIYQCADFYICIKLADDLHIRRMNLVYEQQLDLCERHQKETEFSVLQIRDVRHSMRNHLLSILAYAERGNVRNLLNL